MLSAERKKKLLGEAAGLAQRLHAAEVTRAELRTILAALFRSPGSWVDRSRKARTMLDLLPQSWVANRSKTTRGQLVAIGHELRSVVGEAGLAEEESAFLLGWLSRLLHIKDLEKRERDRH